jgi:hypothetical protein
MAPRPRHVSVQVSAEYAALKAIVWGLVEQEVMGHIDATASA